MHVSLILTMYTSDGVMLRKGIPTYNLVHDTSKQSKHFHIYTQVHTQT